MRWLYHLLAREAAGSIGERYAPPSLASEGFIHCSFAHAVDASALLYFPVDADLAVLRIDPRRLDVPVEIAATPRGPMPHVHGAIPRDAIRDVLARDAATGAPDRVVGTRFAFVAFEGMTLLDLVGVYDPIARIAGAHCEIVGAQDPAAWRGGSATLTVERVRPPLDEFDVLCVPGGLAARALQHDPAVAAWLATFPPNRLAASVCTGALLLGAAGRLRGKRATTHASATHLLAAHGAIAVDERVVDEGQLVTAGGVTSALDLGLHLVRRLEGDDVADAIARQMEYRDQRGRERQSPDGIAGPTASARTNK